MKTGEPVESLSLSKILVLYMRKYLFTYGKTGWEIYIHMHTNVMCLSKEKKVACSTNVLCRIHVKHILLKELRLKTHQNHITWPLILIWGVFLKERETCMFKGSFLQNISNTCYFAENKNKNHQNPVMWPLKLLILMWGVFLKDKSYILKKVFL